MQAANVDAELKENGFYSLIFTKGVPPPMTFAYETSDGRRGIFQFSGYTHEGALGDSALVRYKQLHHSTSAGATDSSDQSGARDSAGTKWRAEAPADDLSDSVPLK